MCLTKGKDAVICDWRCTNRVAGKSCLVIILLQFRSSNVLSTVGIALTMVAMEFRQIDCR